MSCFSILSDIYGHDNYNTKYIRQMIRNETKSVHTNRR